MPAHPVLCRCGHAQQAHTHLRKGSDCGLCGRAECRAFSPAARPAAAGALMSRVFRRSRELAVVVTHPRYRAAQQRPLDGSDDDSEAREA